MKLDLHLHSHVSDGQLSPAQLVDAAVGAGLGLIALTDHDTAAGVPEAVKTAEGRPLRVVPGIEISTREGEHEYHILGYWIDPGAPAILAHQEASVVRRRERMEGMIAKLDAQGAPVTMEAVLQAAGPAARSLGRPHLARALLAAGHTRYYGEAFVRFIGDGGPAFVAQGFPSVAESVERIHSAGGVAVWAHPPLERLDVELGRFAAAGLDGVECFRPSQTPAETERLRSAARAAGLFATGGSDWHGPHRSELGDFHLVGSQVEELLAAGGLTSQG